MLELREYTKEEIMSICGFTDKKASNIITRLERMGYRCESNGKKGKNYRLTITAIPGDRFKDFCVSKLGIPAQSDFRILKTFFCKYFCEPEFQQLPFEDMERELEKEGKNLNRQIISKWVKFFIKKGWVNESNADYTYYCTVRTAEGVSAIPITKEEYTAAWKRFGEVMRETKFHQLAWEEMRRVNGGTSYRKKKIEENGFYSELIDALVEAIESEEK